MSVVQLPPNMPPEVFNLLPYVVILSGLLGILCILLPLIIDSAPVQKFICFVKHQCYHDMQEFACKVAWQYCSICANELNEPNNYHPVIIYKCSKCGIEVERKDHTQVRQLDFYVPLPSLDT